MSWLEFQQDFGPLTTLTRSYKANVGLKFFAANSNKIQKEVRK